MSLRLRVLGLLAFLAFTTYSFTQTPAKIEAFREALRKEINGLRKEKGAGALKRNKLLDAAAQKHVENLARQDKIGDDGKNPHVLDGKRNADRIKAEGYAFAETYENLSMDIKTNQKLDPAKCAAAHAKGWHASPVHHKNLMNPAMVETGIGIAQGKNGKWFYCQVFARPRAK